MPESPRWLFIHGRESEAEEIVTDIEKEIRDDGAELEEPGETITIRQRHSIGFPMIAKTVFTLYPRRTVLCFSLFVGQAFLDNAFFFTYCDTLTTFLDGEQTGWYLAIFAASNFLGAALMVAGGVVEVFLGVKAEGQALESIAQPLTAEDADSGDARPAKASA